MNHTALMEALQSQQGQQRLAHLYGHRDDAVQRQTARYTALISRHAALFGPQENVLIVSAPGRTEIVGNHTDHNRGRVLAAAINLDTLAVVSLREDMVVNLHSEGYPAITMDLSDLAPHPEERETTAALIRGVADGLHRRGYRVGGFDAAVTSQVLGGSGLSSSAAFEVMVCCALDALYNDCRVDAVARAQISQYAENVHFGKPSGLMDQMASSVGGMTAIDFEGEQPVIDPLGFDFDQAGYALVVVGPGGSHDDLTPQYAAIREEMTAVAHQLGADTLRGVPHTQFDSQMAELRANLGDRAVLRAMHYYAENQRVGQAVAALRAHDLQLFFDQVNTSGRSSWQWLQNIAASDHDQPLALALAIAQEQLDGHGACRVHGGGFAGTTLNFVPNNKLEQFVGKMNAVFGHGCCYVLDVRPEGAARVL